MTFKNNMIQLCVMTLAVGIFAVGCDQVSTVTETNAVVDTTRAQSNAGDCCADAAGSTSCCGRCESEQVSAEATGCCGKCAEEAALESQKSECCGACADGDSTNCCCAGEDSVDAEASKEGVSADANTPQAAQDSKVNSFAEDRDLFHFLLTNKDKITRTVKEIDNGVETLTESPDPEIVGKIQEHVASMYRRVEDVRPIRMRDPLFREIFQHADQIEMQVENTSEGIKVTETSSDEYVVKLIQAHAKVVSGFVEKGFEEARQNHEPPQK